MNPEMMADVAGWAVLFARAVQKIKEGSEAEGSAITLTQDECKALATGLRVAFDVGEKS